MTFRGAPQTDGKEARVAKPVRGSTIARDIAQGGLAGIAGGLLAAWAMVRWQRALSRWSADGSVGKAEALGGSDRWAARQQDERQGEIEPATVRAVSAVSAAAIDRPLHQGEKDVAGVPYATALWLAADEAGLWLAGLSKPPARRPVSSHVYALSSHVVFGLVTELTRRRLRAGTR
jgi:putative membrane protein